MFISRVHAMEVCLFLSRLAVNCWHNSNYYVVCSDGIRGVKNREFHLIWCVLLFNESIYFKYSKMDKMAKDKVVRSPGENGGG
jgi:hypothetical protein